MWMTTYRVGDRWWWARSLVDQIAVSTDELTRDATTATVRLLISPAAESAHLSQLEITGIVDDCGVTVSCNAVTTYMHNAPHSCNQLFCMIEYHKSTTCTTNRYNGAWDLQFRCCWFELTPVRLLSVNDSRQVVYASSRIISYWL